MIKYWDYKYEYKGLKRNILNLVNKVFSSGSLLLGKELKNFEKNFCKFNNSKYGLGVANGTDALYIALKSLNIKKGDEVITVSNTAIPTVAAIINSGATVKFVDIGEDYLMDVNKIERLIHTSTSEVYGEYNKIPISELTPQIAKSPYSATKIAADQLAYSYYKTYNIPLSIIRPFNTYGPRQSNRAIIPTIITQIIDNQKITCKIETKPDRYKRKLGECFINDKSLSRILVKNGYAFDYPKYSKKKYFKEQEYARTNRLGIWNMKFEFPCS